MPSAPLHASKALEGRAEDELWVKGEKHKGWQTRGWEESRDRNTRGGEEPPWEHGGTKQHKAAHSPRTAVPMQTPRLCCAMTTTKSEALLCHPDQNISPILLSGERQLPCQHPPPFFFSE